MGRSTSVEVRKALWEGNQYLVEDAALVRRGIAQVEEESFSHYNMSDASLENH
jgi:hypothetical protein